MHPPRIPVLSSLQPGTIQRHLATLPGSALTDEPRPVITVTGARPGAVLFVGAGIHGGEYPPIEAIIRLSKTIDPHDLAGTLVLMPLLNLPAFWTRTPFVCPIDGINPNRVFPGAVDGSYSEQMTHALINELIVYADAYIDLHSGDIPEALVPFTICRGGTEPVDVRSKELAAAFGLPYLLTVTRSIQPAKGASSYVAAAERGVPAFIAEAGGMGQLQPDAVTLLTAGVLRVLAHLEMIKPRVDSASRSKVFTAFEWVYTKKAGMFYPAVAPDDVVRVGDEIGRIGSLFGDTLEIIAAPVDGRVLFLTISPAVQANGLLVGIGTGEEI